MIQQATHLHLSEWSPLALNHGSKIPMFNSLLLTFAVATVIQLGFVMLPAALSPSKPNPASRCAYVRVFLVRLDSIIGLGLVGWHFMREGRLSHRIIVLSDSVLAFYFFARNCSESSCGKSIGCWFRRFLLALSLSSVILAWFSNDHLSLPSLSLSYFLRDFPGNSFFMASRAVVVLTLILISSSSLLADELVSIPVNLAIDLFMAMLTIGPCEFGIDSTVSRSLFAIVVFLGGWQVFKLALVLLHRSPRAYSVLNTLRSTTSSSIAVFADGSPESLELMLHAFLEEACISSLLSICFVYPKGSSRFADGSRFCSSIYRANAKLSTVEIDLTSSEDIFSVGIIGFTHFLFLVDPTSAEPSSDDELLLRHLFILADILQQSSSVSVIVHGKESVIVAKRLLTNVSCISLEESSMNLIRISHEFPGFNALVCNLFLPKECSMRTESSELPEYDASLEFKHVEVQLPDLFVGVSFYSCLKHFREKSDGNLLLIGLRLGHSITDANLLLNPGPHFVLPDASYLSGVFIALDPSEILSLLKCQIGKQEASLFDDRNDMIGRTRVMSKEMKEHYVCVVGGGRLTEGRFRSFRDQSLVRNVGSIQIVRETLF